LPNGFSLEQGPCLSHETVPSKIETHQDLTIHLPGSILHAVCLLKGHGQWLLNENMLSCIKRSQSDVGMKLSRHTDCDEVNHCIIQECKNVGIAISDMKSVGNLFEASGIGIGQRYDLCVIKPTQCRKVAKCCHPSTADDTNSKGLSDL
jgi:hypothetical protein